MHHGLSLIIFACIDSSITGSINRQFGLFSIAFIHLTALPITLSFHITADLYYSCHKPTGFRYQLTGNCR